MIYKNLDGTTRPTFLIGNGLTTTQRLALTNKKIGLLVYDTTTSSFWWWDGSVWKQFGIGSSGYAPYTFFGTGYYRIATGIDIQSVSPGFASIAVIFKREIAGTSGTTEIDILVNGSSMFLVANRPKIVFSAGNAATVIVVPDYPTIPPNARIEMNIVGVEAGDPQDMTAQIF